VTEGTAAARDRLLRPSTVIAPRKRPVGGPVAAMPTGLVAVFDEPIDLGVVFKARCIDECVQIVLARSGLTQRPSTQELPTATQASPADELIADGS